MIYLREASEDEMILEFLRGEIKSKRFQSQIMVVNATLVYVKREHYLNGIAKLMIYKGMSICRV